MMADAVEAAVRSLRERTPSRIQGVVHSLVRDRLDDGQFDECDMTLQDLARVEAAFLPVLAGTLHERIEYPEDTSPAPVIDNQITEETPETTEGDSDMDEEMPHYGPTETM